MKRRKVMALLLFPCFLCGNNAQLNDEVSNVLLEQVETRPRNWRFKQRQAAREITYKIDFKTYFRDLFYDVAQLHAYLISWESFKILSSMLPFYLASRMVDNRLQSQFHDELHHKNMHQFPRWCHDFAEKSLAAPIIFFGINAFVSKDKDLQQTSRMYLLGMPFVVFGKDILKKLEWDICKRPWNEKFDCKERAHGGFPSGHMAEATYTAVLYGMRYGAKAAVPLGVWAASLGITFLNCNRHYFSQLVAGAVLGSLYAVSANKIVNTRLRDDLHIGLAMNEYGGPSFKLSYRF